MNFKSTLFAATILMAFLPIILPANAATEIDTASLHLVDEDGNSVNLDDYAASTRLVFFGYTYCPDICPLTLYSIATALKKLGSVADDIEVLFISVDPKRDTPEVLAKYTDAFHPQMIGLTGTYEQIEKAVKAFRTTFGYHVEEDGRERPLSAEEYQEVSAESAYVPYHSSQIYLLGAMVNYSI